MFWAQLVKLNLKQNENARVCLKSYWLFILKHQPALMTKSRLAGVSGFLYTRCQTPVI